ncbi:hypothetical protein [Sediminibacterium sp.]|uniref:hypothetical protein n=1 Tax=Sediminibacterium sp. TaxID=1917865 RepID=UPI0027255A4C|nr:hypothetical protein [Sediminibacterium sp.]MDO9000438.1 hypothetical protein [Bacteroidota bacterium]MDP3146994.1 hypothetical protein [Bacteroidota bacterium]MDP3567469.1 hypothetical protein [Sediminibacterium sp.]
MKLKKNYFALLILSASISLNAQDNQTVKAEKMGEGKYTPYLTNPSNGAYNFEGLDKGIWTVEIKPYESDLKQLSVKKYEEATDMSTYYPDNAAFPCTYVSGRLQSHKAMAGYKGISFNNEDRIVFIDEWVYVLNKWKDKDNYVIDKCLKKGEVKGLKVMKAVMSSKKDGEKAKHVETLQNYLNDAFKKQAEVLATAEGKKKSDDYQNELTKGEKRWDLVRDSINGKYWNSEEGKKKQAEMAQAQVTLVNDMKVDLLMHYGSGVSQRLKPGEKTKFACKHGDVYRAKLRPNNTTQFDSTGEVLLKLDGTGCGRIVNASQIK